MLCGEETTIYHSQFSTCSVVPSCNITPRQFVSEFSSTICKTLFSKLKVRIDIDLPQSGKLIFDILYTLSLKCLRC